jgi:hypothetical protein
MDFSKFIVDAQKGSNKQGNSVLVGRSPYENRYKYDFELCPPPNWVQYDTWQDASYFGIWVNTKEHIVVTYAEGDMYIVECPTKETYHAELKNMAEAYGPTQNPAFTAIDDQGNITHYYDKRPE